MKRKHECLQNTYCAGSIPARASRRGGRAVECTGLENLRGSNVTASSNLALSAMYKNLSDSPFFNVILFSLFWAIQIFVSKLGFIAGAEVIPFTVQSGIFAIILLSLYIFIFKREKLKELTKDILFGLIIANAIHNGLGSVLSNAGVSLTTAINAGFLVQFTTVTTSTLAWLVLKERMTKTKILTIFIIMFGTFLLVTKGRLNSLRIGDLLILLACVSWSTGNVLIKKIIKKHRVDSDIITFLRPISGLPLMMGFILLAPLYPGPTRDIFQANLFNFDQILYAFLNGFFAVMLWIFLNRTLKVASASYMTMMSSLTPVLVAFLAIVFLRETLIPIQWVGVVLISLSGIVTQLLKIEKH